MLHAVIMAGGAGTRFWPRSTRQKPKQFLSLFNDGTMLQATVERIRPLIPDERVWVITNKRYVDLVTQQLPEVPEANIIGEPVAKNTAPCVAAAAALISRQDDDATMAVLPADHLIAEPEAFRSVLKAGARQAQQSEALVTMGIKPTRAETGYGYIEFDKQSGQSVDKHPVRKVIQFREKPNLTTARQFIYAGRFLWNSGMFMWTASTILDQFDKHLPEVAKPLTDLQAKLGEGSTHTAVDTFYEACPSVSIDYGIMEKAEDVFVMPCDFGWNDMGSWKALYELSDKDVNENVLNADRHLTEESTGNLVSSTGDKKIALVGVENLAIVETEQSILVCNLDKAQGVKQIVNQLRDKKDDDFL